MMSSGDPGRGHPTNRPGQYWWFAFQALQSELKAKGPSLHRSRDGGPAELVAGILGSLGYRPGPILFNYPDRDSADADLDELLDSSQVLLLTTRPPLDPSTRKPIDRSGSALEQRVFACLRTFLAYCSRSTIELSDNVERLLGDDKKYLARADFSMYVGAPAVDDGVDLSNRSFGYMISAAAVWPNGPRLLAIFSAGGTETLAWGYILVTKYRDILERALGSDRDIIAIGEFTLPYRDLDRRGSLGFLEQQESVLTVCELSS